MSQTIVPFGFGVGGFLDVGGLKLTKQDKSAQGERRALAADAKHLSDVVSSFGGLLPQLNLSDVQQTQLQEHLAGCKEILVEMTTLLQQHQRPNDSSTWHKRLRWDKDAAQSLRDRMAAHISMLNLTCSTMGQVAVLGALQAFQAEMKSGRRRTPSASSLSKASETGEPNSEWREIGTGLEELVITAALATKHKDMILQYFTDALALNYLDDGASDPDGGGSDNACVNPDLATWLEDDEDHDISVTGDDVEAVANKCPPTSAGRHSPTPYLDINASHRSEERSTHGTAVVASQTTPQNDGWH